MKNYETKEVIKKERVLVSMTCDVCGCEIYNKYYTVSTGHNDWLYSSHESTEYFEICSNKCLADKYEEYLNGTSETSYIEIEKERI